MPRLQPLPSRRDAHARPSLRPHAERGTAIVEFALVFPFLLVLTLCVIDVSRAFFIKNIAVQAAREAARTAVVLNASAAPDSAAARAQQVVDAASVTMTQCAFADLGNRQWRVTVSVQFNWLYPGLFNWLGAGFTNPVTLTAASVMRKEGP
jgi:Flp pilus assembly protein TadG